ncbi:MAG: hypothetical protein HY579_06455 [Nitrospinae bacterium]|nr:hypothetical protein [Nitrospinota bacterium]
MKEKKRIALFLGSGATAGSGIQKNGISLPTDSQFFDKEKGCPKIIADGEDGYPALKLYRDRDNVRQETSLYQTWNDLFILRSFALAGIVRETQETLHAFNGLANRNWPDNYDWRAQHYDFQFRLMNQSPLPIEFT